MKISNHFKKLQSIPIIIFCCVVLLCVSSSVFAGILIPTSQDVNGIANSTGGSWRYNYKRIFDGEKITKDVEIGFIFDANSGLNMYEQDEYMDIVKRLIEQQWNNKYGVSDFDNLRTYPCGVNVTFTEPNYWVKVWKGGEGPPTNMSNWHVNDPVGFPSHEFGHMLGLFDEYTNPDGSSGWLDPANPIVDNNVPGVLMGRGCLLANSDMPERYYKQYEDFIKSLDPTNPFGYGLVKIPEPAALLLIYAGSALFLRRRRAA